MTNTATEKDVLIIKKDGNGTKIEHYPITKDCNVIVTADEVTLDTKLETLEASINTITTVATPTVNGLMSSTDKAKMDLLDIITLSTTEPTKPGFWFEVLSSETVS